MKLRKVELNGIMEPYAAKPLQIAKQWVPVKYLFCFTYLTGKKKYLLTCHGMLSHTKTNVTAIRGGLLEVARTGQVSQSGGVEVSRATNDLGQLLSELVQANARQLASGIVGARCREGQNFFPALEEEEEEE